MYHNILAAVNEHSNSEVAARYAIHLARACRARLTLMFVAGSQVGLEAIRPAEAALERLFLEAGANQVEVESLIQKGDPLRQISTVVREKAIDLVFSASRRQDVSRRYFVQTLSRQHWSNWPVPWPWSGWCTPASLSPKRPWSPFGAARLSRTKRPFSWPN